MTDVKVSTETLFSLQDLYMKFEEHGIYFANYDQLIQHLADEKLKEMNTNGRKLAVTNK